MQENINTPAIVKIINNEPVTDTFCLAEGSGSDHASVIKLVRNYQKDLGEFGLLDFKSESTGGRPTEYALLNEHQATLLLTYMKNTPRIRDFKKRLVKAFFEMARKLKNQDPVRTLNDPAAMRGLLLTYTEKVLALEEEKKALTPKAEALDRIATSEGSTCVTDTAKSLQIRPKELFAYLSFNQWVYRRPGGKGWIAYQNRIQQGLLEHKVTVVTRGDGTEKITEQVRVTPKGLSRLAQAFSVEEVAA